MQKILIQKNRRNNDDNNVEFFDVIVGNSGHPI